jgi:hypothetical protein
MLFTYLPLLFLSLFPRVGVSLLFDGCLNICRVLVLYLYCLVVAWVRVVEWEDVGEVCTIILCKSCIML